MTNRQLDSDLRKFKTPVFKIFHTNNTIFTFGDQKKKMERKYPDIRGYYQDIKEFGSFWKSPGGSGIWKNAQKKKHTQQYFLFEILNPAMR